MKLLNKKVLLGLSGGVDSTTAALLLKEKGFEVTGYFFDITGNNEDGRKDAENAASQLGIELICENLSNDFNEQVISNFCEEYLKGRTPNPCIICNPLIKFRKLTETADKIGAAYIATGHYARVFHDEKEDLYYVQVSANLKKDQSYMLYRLPQSVLSRLIFPLGDFEDKALTRNLAREKNLFNAEKKDSQEICFVGENDDYVSYILGKGYVSEPGNFTDKNGNVLGEHKGIINYTLGQRKGLGIALGKPAFVTKIDFKNNQVILGDNQDLFSKIVISKNNFFTARDAEYYDNAKVFAKVRYSAKPQLAVLKVDGDVITAIFKDAQRAATPGQSIVFYDNDLVIGGGFID